MSTASLWPDLGGGLAREFTRCVRCCSVPTRDLDYPEIIALTHVQSPSLIVFSLQDETAENINRLLERFLPEVESQLRGRALARAAVVERGIRAVEVSRYLGVSQPGRDYSAATSA